MMSFEQIVEKIVGASDLSSDEIIDRVKKVREKYELLTPEGAARIVAKELGVEIGSKEVVVRPLKIEDLAPGMSRVDLVARVVRIHPLREFQYSSGRGGKRGSLLLQDKTGYIRMTLWDNQAEILEGGHIQKGDVVRVKNGYVVKGIDNRPELRLGSRGNIELNPEDPRTDELPPFSGRPTKISELKTEQREVDVMGRVVGLSEVRTFERPGGGIGRVATLTLDDGSGVVRVSLWDEWADAINKLKLGDPVMLENANVKEGFVGGVELSVGSRGRLIQNPPGAETLPEVTKKILKIKDVEPGMPSVSLVARVRRVLPLVEFKRKDGSPAKVRSAILEDETGTIRLSFWEDSVGIAEKLKGGDILNVEDAYSKTGLRGTTELHVGRKTRVEINPAGVSVGELKPVPTKLGDVGMGDECLEVVGRISEVYQPREFTKSDGSIGKVASFTMADETGFLRVSLWHENADLVSNMKVGDVVKLIDAHSSPGLHGRPELHLNVGGRVEINPPGVVLPPLEELKSKSTSLQRTEISAIDREGERVEIKGTIVHVFQRKPVFYVCPDCGRTLGGEEQIICENCGKSVTPEHRLVVSVLCDDGTDNVRVTLFGKVAEDLLGVKAEEVSQQLKTVELDKVYEGMNLLGKEIIVRGVVKYDRFTENLVLRGFEVEEPKPQEEATLLLEEIKSLRGKVSG